jgi:hypothetical protein
VERLALVRYQELEDEANRTPRNNQPGV